MKEDNPYNPPKTDPAPQANTVTEGVSSSLYEIWRWKVFFATWLAYGGFYLTRKAFALAKVELEKPEVMGMTEIDFAWIDGAYLTAYAAGQFLWGICGDRFGTRRVILIGMMASIIVAAAMGGSSTVWLMGSLFCLQGLCQSTGWAPLAKNVGEFFSQRERGWVMGFWCTNYAFGGFFASALAGASITYFGGWQYAFWVPATVLLGVWFLFLLFQRNRPEDVGLPPIEQYHGEPEALIEKDEETEEAKEGSWAVVREVLSNRMIWLLGIVYFFLKPTRYMVLFSSPLYVNWRLGGSAAESGILSAMFDLAGPVGVLFGGFCSDFLFKSKRIPMSVIGLVGVAIVLVCMPYLPDTRLAMGLGFFGIGFFLYIPDSLVSGTAAIDFGTKRGASTAAGFINGCGSIGAIIGGTMPGWLKAILGERTDIWPYVFNGLAVSILIAAALLIPQWNRMPPSKDVKNNNEDLENKSSNQNEK